MKRIVLIGLALACASEDSRECVPGASEADRFCSDDGYWITREDNVEVVREPAIECKGLDSGEYLLNYRLSGGSSVCPPLPPELFVVRTDGTVVSGEKSDNCHDSVSVDSCQRTGIRKCRTDDCEVDVIVTVDMLDMSGKAQVSVDCDGTFVRCLYDVEISKQ